MPINSLTPTQMAGQAALRRAAQSSASEVAPSAALPPEVAQPAGLAPEGFDWVVGRDSSGRLVSVSLLSELPNCPIDQDSPTAPVLASDGQVYSRAALSEWVSNRSAQGEWPTSPISREPLDSHVRPVVVGALFGSGRAMFAGSPQPLAVEASRPRSPPRVAAARPETGPNAGAPTSTAAHEPARYPIDARRPGRPAPDPERAIGRWMSLELPEDLRGESMERRIEVVMQWTRWAPPRTPGQIGSEDTWRLLNSVQNEDEARVLRDAADRDPAIFQESARMTVLDQFSYTP